MKIAFFTIVTLTLSSATLYGQGAHISDTLRSANPKSNVDVIVRYRHSPTLANHQLVNSLGGKLKTELRSINSGSYSLVAANLQALAADPDVISISPDRKVHMLIDNSAAAVNASAAWNLNLDGTGIGIAVIDSGISEHDDLQSSYGSRVVYRQSFVNSDGNDHFGHG